MADVRLRDVVKTYGAARAVDSLNLHVADGEFVALVGPSGCGKTTTLNLVAGLVELTSGTIHIGDRDVSRLDPRDRDIALVFQNYALYPNKTVRGNLAFPLQMRKLPRAEVEAKVVQAAGLLGIAHLLDRRPRELSGGQQQRVALGRALVRDPKAFLMDEPLSNLDAKLRGQMRSELKRFQKDLRATVIYVTHDQLEAVTMADRMAVMRDGILQQYDTPDRVFDHPANTFVAGFVGSPAMNLLPAQVTGQDGCAVLTSPDGWTLPLDGPAARRALLAPSGTVVLGARHSSLSLHGAAQPGTVPGRVHTVEPTGDVTYVHLRVGASEVVASAPPSVRPALDGTLWIGFDPHRVSLFDGQSQQALPLPEGAR